MALGAGYTESWESMDHLFYCSPFKSMYEGWRFQLDIPLSSDRCVRLSKESF